MFDVKLTYLKMSIAKISKFLLATETKLYTRRSLFWLGLSLFFTVIYASLALKLAFGSEYVMQDDARQHIFWMSRFSDPELFKSDLIADYYESISPWGVKTLYRGVAMLGIEPQTLSKLLPGILAIIITVFCFVVSLELLPIPFGAFVISLLFSQNVWAQNGTISGTAKDFVYPLFFAFLYYWLRRSLLGVCITIILAAISYPPTVLIFAGALFWQLWQFKGFIPRLNPNKQVLIFSGVALALSFVLLLPYALSSGEYGPTITLEQARNIPQFAPGGRTAFFDDNLWEYWVSGRRTGLRLYQSFVPYIAATGLFLPWLFKFPQRYHLLRQVSPKISYLRDLLIASMGWFVLAHIVLFKLYLPSRYMSRSLRAVMAIAAGIFLLAVLEAVFRWAVNHPGDRTKSFIALAVTALFFTLLIGFPISQKPFLNTYYIKGKHSELYQFIEAQPKDTLVASLTDEADNISSFAHRSVLSSQEHAIPYHTGYFIPLRQRLFNLIEAQYTGDLAVAKDFINRYGVDLWLIDESSFNADYLRQNRWLRDQQPVTQKAIAKLEAGVTPAIAKLQSACTIFQDGRYLILESKCILEINNLDRQKVLN
ncbi:MAG: hypothetical protein AAFY50_21400 [Cyanobacteria bacterium J06648_1]